MVVFFSDIDNTLIFSHRKSYAGKKIVAEYLNGKEQSYMPENLYCFLKDADCFNLVPVTTRSVEQYNRLFLLNKNLNCNYALVCNGGILLKNGVVDSEWRNESLRISAAQNEEVEHLYKFTRNYLHENKVYRLEPFMFYIVAENRNKTYGKLLREADMSKVFLGRDSRKIYVIAKSITKGEAVLRFQKKYAVDKKIIAGDSEFDISMLELGDVGIISKSLYGKLQNKNVYVSKADMLPSDINNIFNIILDRGFIL